MQETKIGKTGYLTEDVISYGKDKTVYGRAGDKVKVISDNITALIVEGKKGIRFSIPSIKFR